MEASSGAKKGNTLKKKLLKDVEKAMYLWFLQEHIAEGLQSQVLSLLRRLYIFIVSFIYTCSDAPADDFKAS